jgi:hypothetical protein
MKVFWALIILLAVGGLGWMWLHSSGGQTNPETVTRTASNPGNEVPVAKGAVEKQPSREATSSAPAPITTAQITTAPIAAEPTATSPGPINATSEGGSSSVQLTAPVQRPSAGQADPEVNQATAMPDEVPFMVEINAPVLPTTETDETPEESLRANAATTANTPAAIPDAGVPSPLPGPKLPPSMPPAPATPAGAAHSASPATPTEYKPLDKPAAPHTVVNNADGSIRVDDRFNLTGEGTKDKPYVLTWELLVSAAEEYSPREGRTELPERVKMFHGKHVEITGNVAFPLMVEEPRELLSMLNQWDGCCIGVPPTPYDAVEVKLKKSVRGPERLTSYGVVRGTLKVEPQLVGKWLVALYAMEEAELIPKGYGGFTP